MTLKVEVRNFEWRPGETGRLLKFGNTHTDAHAFVKDFTEGQEGWIETDYGYSPHIRGHKDGLGAVLTDARISPGDYDYFVRILGQEAANIITRHHNIY